jgi:putative endonuclease
VKPRAAHLAVGQAAEEAARRHLERAGYQLVARNFRSRLGELDIVAIDGDTLALVEVRYRSRRDFGGAAASITATKRVRLVRAAQALLARHPELARRPARFDVVEVEGEPANLRCRLIRAAFSL